jgi:PAS domain S-box-containing protein
MTILDPADFPDITSIDDVRDALEQSTQRLHALLEQMPDPVAVHRHGRFIYVNPTLCEHLGYDDPNKLLGQPVLKFIHPNDQQAARERIEVMITTGEKVPPAKQRYIRRDGRTITVEVHDQLMSFGDMPAFVTIGRDVTRQQELLARTMQDDRKFAVGTLATGVAHEINNPLSYAKASTEFVLQRLEDLADSPSATIDADDLAAMIDALRDCTSGLERIRGIVNDLDTFVDHHDGTLALIDVVETLQASVNLVASSLDARAHVVRELRDVPRVRANRGQLAEVFTNVLTNAMRSFPGSGPQENELSIATAYANDQVTITIVDNGCGMSEEVLACVFDPFFSTREEGAGTGLGLTIAHNTLESMGGGIEIDSTPGEGTTVRMWLPALEPEGMSEMAEDTQPIFSLQEDTVRDA